MNTVSLAYIYFFYGLAFFVMGLAVVLELGRTSELRLARSIPWLAAFGLVHGSHEWIEMFEEIGFLPDWFSLDAVRVVLLVVSFTCLAAFGLSLMSRTEKPERMKAMWQTLALLAICLAGMGVLRVWFGPSEWIVVASVWARYSLGVVGSLITSWALVSQGRLFAQSGMARFGRDMIWAAMAFALYGIVGQMFVQATRLPPSNIINSDLFLRLFGMPVQLFRGLTAIAVAVSMTRALRVFETERNRQLQAAQAAALEAERRVQHETAQLNRQLQEAINDLSVLFEVSRILSATLDLPTLLNQAVTKVIDLLPAPEAMILLNGSPSPSVAASIWLEDDKSACPMDVARAIGENVIAAAKAGQITLHIEDRLIAVPLLAQQVTIGSLVIGVRDASIFEAKRSWMTTLGHELGIAIENARMYSQLQERGELRGDLLRKSVEAQEEERKRIARELHDGIGQIFTALALGLSGVEETMPRDPALARKQVGNLKDLSIRAITEMRQLVDDLRPPQLDDLGLVPALHWLADEWRERLHIEVRLQAEGQRRRLMPEVETILFRITQEGLTNIAKHARARHAGIRLTFDVDSVRLLVEDDGVGMVPEQINRHLTGHSGWGLAGIRERAALVGGTFDIDSAPGRGTRLTVHIPVRAEEVIA